MAEHNARKRKTPSSPLVSKRPEDKKLNLNPSPSSTSNLTLTPSSSKSSSSNPRLPSQSPQPPPQQKRLAFRGTPSSPPTRRVPRIYQWSTEKPATVQSLAYLRAHNVKKICGKVVCECCKVMYDYEFDLEQKYREITEFIWINRHTMRSVAMPRWSNPEMMDCDLCNSRKSVRPVIAALDDQINWLFLFLGQMLGFCTTDQLRYFCHMICKRLYDPELRDRMLLLTYFGLYKQLDPSVSLTD